MFADLKVKSLVNIPILQIKESQLRRLEEGEGFYLKLNVDQRRAVLNMVTNKRPLRVYTLFGPAGTGKTLTLVAFCLQLHLHTIEQRPCDAACVIYWSGLKQLVNFH